MCFATMRFSAPPAGRSAIAQAPARVRVHVHASRGRPTQPERPKSGKRVPGLCATKSTPRRRNREVDGSAPCRGAKRSKPRAPFEAAALLKRSRRGLEHFHADRKQKASFPENALVCVCRIFGRKTGFHFS